MRLLALTYGTEGDTRPLAMLCHGLIGAGHAVTLLADGGTLGSAQALDVPHAALEGDIHDDVVALVSRGNGVAAASTGLGRMALQHVSGWMRQADAAAEGCDAILTGGLAAFVGMSVGERRRIPVIGSGMIPLTPTRAFRSPFLPPGRSPGWLNRASYGWVNGLIWRQFRRPINAARQQLGQSPRRALWSGLPMLYGISPQLLPPPADWPADHIVCGQWRLPDAPWAPPADLRAFLDAGPPPVYLGFGSMTGFDRERVLPALLQALAPRRVLLFPGWVGLPAVPALRTRHPPRWQRHHAFGLPGRHSLAGDAVRCGSVLLGRSPVSVGRGTGTVVTEATGCSNAGSSHHLRRSRRSTRARGGPGRGDER